MHIGPAYSDFSAVTAVIVTYQKEESVLALLDSLNEALSAGLRIIVVDNASTDGTVEEIDKKYGDAIELIALAENTGGSGGFNTGMERALENSQCRYIWLLDNDVLVRRDTLSVLKGFIESEVEAGAVGSMMVKMGEDGIVNEVGGSVDWDKGRLVHHYQGMNEEEVPPEPLEVEYCAAASLLVRRQAIEDSGLMKNYFIHFDDVEWCLRMRDFGWKVFAHPKSVFEHESYDYKPVTWIRYYDTRNLLHLYKDRHAQGLGRKKRRFRILALHMDIMGLHEKARQIRMAISDFNTGILGRREIIPLQTSMPIQDIAIESFTGEIHFLSPDGPKLVELLESVSEAGVVTHGMTAIVYHYVERKLERKILDEFGIRLVHRSHPVMGVVWILASQFIRRSIRKEMTIIHYGFEHRRCYPHQKRRFFVHPKGGIAIS